MLDGFAVFNNLLHVNYSDSLSCLCALIFVREIVQGSTSVLTSGSH